MPLTKAMRIPLISAMAGVFLVLGGVLVPDEQWIAMFRPVPPSRKRLDGHELHTLPASRLSAFLTRVTALGATRPELPAPAQGQRLKRLPPDHPAARDGEGEDEKMLNPDGHQLLIHLFV